MTQSDTTIESQQPSSEPATPSPRRQGGRLRLAVYVVGVALVVIGIATLAGWLATGRRDIRSLAGMPGGSTKAATAWQRPVVSDAGLVARSGVRVVQVALTGGGGLIDLRFQVVNPDKAGAVHDTTTPPAVVDETTGLVADQLLMGHSHTEGFTAGQTYYLVFENPGNLVRRGSTVSVLLGNAEVDHVEVR